MTDNTINENLVNSQGSPISSNNNGIANTTSKPLENSVKSTTPLSFLDNQQEPIKPLSFLDNYVAPKQQFEGNIYDSLYQESPLDTSNRDFLTGGEDMFTRDFDTVRGERQGIGAQMIKGVGRVGTKVASEIVKLPGYIGGAAISPFIDNKDSVLETIFNNQYVRGVAGAEEAVNNSLLAVYNSEKTQRGEGFENFLNNITSTSFWANEGADGIGFLVSMMVPGLILNKIGAGTKLIGASAKGMEQLGLASSKYEALYGMASKGLTKANVDVGVSTLANTFIEAGAEAAGAMTNFEDSQREILNKKFKEGQDSLLLQLQTGLITDEQYEQESSDLLTSLEDQLKEQKGILGADIFKANLAILLGPNLLQNKMLYGGLAKNSNLVIKEPKALKTASKEFGKGFLSEGFWEEGMQTTVENYYSNKANDLNLKGFLNDTNLGGVWDEYLNTLTTSEGMKSIFLGGMLGGPMSAYHGVNNAKNNYQRSLAMTSLIDANITNNTAVNASLYKTDSEGNYELDELGNPIIDPLGALVGLRQVANSTAVTEYMSTLLNNEDLNNVDSTVKEAFDLVQNSYLQSVASGLITLDPEGDLSIEALTRQYENAREDLKNNESLTEDQRKAQELILNRNENILKSSLNEARIQNEVFNTLAEITDFNSLNFDKANEVNVDKLKENFIKNIKPEFINNQLQLKILNEAKESLEDKIEKLGDVFKNNEKLTKELKDNLEALNKEIEKREKQRDEYFGNIDNIQKRLDEEVIPESNEQLAKTARADKLSSLLDSISKSNTIEELNKITNDEPLINDEFKQALTARRKEIEEEESKLKDEVKELNKEDLDLNKNIESRALNYDQLDSLFEGLNVPLAFKNELLDSFEDSLVHDTIEDFVNDEANESYIQDLLDKHLGEVEELEETKEEYSELEEDFDEKEKVDPYKGLELDDVIKDLQKKRFIQVFNEYTTDRLKDELKKVYNLEHKFYDLFNLDYKDVPKESKTLYENTIAKKQYLENLLSNLGEDFSSLKPMSREELKSKFLINQTNPLLGEVVKNNIYDIIDYNGVQYIIDDINEDGSFKILRLSNTSVSRSIPSDTTYPAYNIGVQVFEDRGYPYHRIEGKIYSAEFKEIDKSDSAYDDLQTIFNNGTDVTTFYPNFVKNEKNESLEKSEEVKEELEETTTDDLNIEDEIKNKQSTQNEVDDKFDSRPLEESVEDSTTSEDINNKELDDVVEDVIDPSDDINQTSDDISSQESNNPELLQNIQSYSNPRVMTYNTNFDEWLDKYVNREGTVLKSNISDNLNDIGENMKSILDDYYNTGVISDENLKQLIYHLPLKVEIIEDGVTHTAYIDAFNQSIYEQGVTTGYNANSAMQAMPLRIHIINELLNSKGKDVDVKIGRQLDGSIQLSYNNENSNIKDLKALNELSDLNKAKYFQNNFLYTNDAYTKTTNGKNHSKVLGKPGDIFLNMSTSKGTVFPLKVNQGKFSNELSTAITKFITYFTSRDINVFKTSLSDVLSSMDPTIYTQLETELKPYIDIAKSNYGEDLPIVKFLNVLVSNNKSDKNKLNFTKGKIQVGTAFFKANNHLAEPLQANFSEINQGVINSIELKTEESKALIQEALGNYLNYLNRNIKADLLKDLNYVKLLLDSNAITTNTDTSVNLFGTPRVFLDADVNSESPNLIPRGLIENDPYLNEIVKDVVLRNYSDVENTVVESTVKTEDVVETVENTIEDLTDNSTSKKKDVIDNKKKEINSGIENKIKGLKDMKPRQKVKYLFDLQKELGLQRSSDVNVKNVDSILEALITENENNPLLQIALEKLC